MGNFYFWLAESLKIFTNDVFQVFYEDSYCNLVPMKKNMVVMDYSYKLAWTQTVYDDNI